MKTKKYEKITLIGILLISILFLEFVLIFSSKEIKISSYLQIPIIMKEEKEGVIVINKEERKKVYENQVIYYKNKKIKYEIIEDNKETMTLRLSKRIKEKEVVMVTIKKKNINLIDMIKNTWGGDNNH